MARVAREDMEVSHDDEGSIVEEVFGPDLGWLWDGSVLQNENILG